MFRIVQAPGIETNQGELARPLIVKYDIGDADTGFFSKSQKHDQGPDHLYEAMVTIGEAEASDLP